MSGKPQRIEAAHTAAYYILGLKTAKRKILPLYKWCGSGV